MPRLLHTLLAIILIGVSHAHQIAEMSLVVEATEDRFLVTVQADAAYMLPEFRGDEDLAAQDLAWLRTRSPLEWARIRKETETYLRQCLSIRSESGELEWSVSFPDFATNPPGFMSDGIAEMPPMVDVRLEGSFVDQELRIKWTEPYDVVLIVQSGEAITPIISGETETILRRASLYDTPASSPASFGSWVQLGFHHILPAGLDHILFILGIFFLNPKWKPLLGKSLIFTLTHSITLGFAMIGWISLPERPVEILIAASILWIGVENLRLRKPSQADLWDHRRLRPHSRPWLRLPTPRVHPERSTSTIATRTAWLQHRSRARPTRHPLRCLRLVCMVERVEFQKATNSRRHHDQSDRALLGDRTNQLSANPLKGFTKLVRMEAWFE